MVGIASGAVLVALIFRRAAGALLARLAGSAALGLAVFALLFWLMPLMLGIAVESSDTYYGARLGSDEARLFLWSIARTYSQQSPWLGIGPMHYAHFHNPVAAHPHNVYLQIAAEWGLPMLLVVLCGAGAALWRFAAAISRCTEMRQRDCGIGLFLACVAVAVDGMFSGNFVMPVAQVWIAFTIGWALAWTRRQPGVDEGPDILGSRVLRRMAAIGLVAAPLWLAWDSWPELAQLDEHVKQVMDRVRNPRMNTRFWSHGWF